MVTQPTFKRQSQDDLLYSLDIDSELDQLGGYNVAYLLERGINAPNEITLSQSWQTYPGCYIFLGEQLINPNQFVADIRRRLPSPAYRGVRFIWIENPQALPQEWSITRLPLQQLSNQTSVRALTAFNFRNLSLFIGSKCSIAFNTAGNAFEIKKPADDAQRIYLTTGGGTDQIYGIGSTVTLSFQGSSVGCLQFELTLSDGASISDTDKMDVGCRLFIEDRTNPDSGVVQSLRYPIFSVKESPIALYATIDPLNLLVSDRTYFSFLKDGDTSKQEIRSYFRTNIGYTVHLTPHDSNSRLVFAVRPSLKQLNDNDSLYLVPSGDFEMTVPRYAAKTSRNAADYDDNLLCGLSGVEYIKLAPEQTNLLCFRPGYAAYAPGFSSNQAPTTNDKPALTDFATTSWAYVRQPDDGSPIYYAQPDEAVLYKPPRANGTEKARNFLSYMEVPVAELPNPGEEIPQAFPLLPYAGVQENGTSLTDYRQLEIQRLSPIRRSLINEISASVEPTQSLAAAQNRNRPAKLRSLKNMALTAAEKRPITGTTPQGLLATFSQDYEKWETLLLAKDAAGNDLKLQELDRQAPLRAALQSNKLFLVISKPSALEKYFKDNQLTIQGWIFNLKPEDWREDTVLIFKFYDKPLLDLLDLPQAWPQPEEFTKGYKTTRDQLAKLFQDAIAKTGEGASQKDLENYGTLANIATSDRWSGIIALNVPVPPQNLPKELAALAAGIKGSKFYAQYVGIQTTPITMQDNELVAGQSSLFGLIDYQDDQVPLPTDSGYNFQVNSLRVLFQNSQIKAFSCEISVTLDRLFDERTQLVNSTTGRNIIVLKGTAENHDGQTTYAFSFSGENHFELPGSAVLNEVEIIKAQFSTDPVDGANITGRFSFWGRLNFEYLPKFDILSFGAKPSPTSPAEPNDKFLSFSNLVVTMKFQLEKPEERTFAFEPGNLAFDTKQSKVREDSLYAKFPLKLTGLTYSSSGKKPSDSGYMPVKSPLGSSNLAQTWYGLTFDLELGSVGALAGKAGIVVSIIAAWSPSKNLDETSSSSETGSGVFVGLRLFGSSGNKKEFSIQGVIKIVFESIEFVVGTNKGKISYLLKLKNIMLKLLTLSIPPTGKSEIIIFGDPEGTAESNTLGWYAAYAKEKAKPKKQQSALPPR